MQLIYQGTLEILDLIIIIFFKNKSLGGWEATSSQGRAYLEPNFFNLRYDDIAKLVLDAINTCEIFCPVTSEKYIE